MENTSMNVMNVNDASSDKWVLAIGGTSRKYSFFTKKVTGFPIPGISAQGEEGPKNRGEFMLDIKADTILFEPLSFTFVIDEDYTNYRLLRKWMMDNAAKNIADREDISVTLLNNQGKVQGVEMTFNGARPINLGDVELDTTGTMPVLTCTVTFKYEWSDFV